VIERHAGIPQIWISRALPPMFKKTKGGLAKVQISGKLPSSFPRTLDSIGDLTCSERCRSTCQHAVRLQLSYRRLATVVAGQPIVGSIVRGLIHIPLSAKAASQIREVSGDEYSFELDLKDVELIDKTPRPLRQAV
jgi:hypothetical protein